MSELKKIIDEYCRSLDSIGWVLPNLNSGIDPTNTLLAEGLQPVESMVELFQWHDGIVEEAGQTIDQIYIFPGYYLISLQEAVTIYKALVESKFYEAGFFPILASGGGDYYLVDLRSNSDKSGTVYKLLEGYFPVLVFSDIYHLFETYKKGIDDGIVYVDDGKYLEMFDNQFSKIAAEINPEIKFWNA